MSSVATQGLTKPLREPIHGVLLLDKPIGLSSQHAMQQARRLLGADKCGHGGTLDPLATGLLPVLFGEATKFSQDLLEADKTYTGEIYLGVRTSTEDREGEVLSRLDVHLDDAQLTAAVAELTGSIEQRPPMYSALKKDGKPLYAYARAGIQLELSPRNIQIHEFNVRRINTHLLEFKVRCSKGTYIRSLARDLGDKLACGAHLYSLRRTAIHHRQGQFFLEDGLALDRLQGLSDLNGRRAALKPIDSLLQTLPVVQLKQELAKRFLQGQRLRLDSPAVEGACRVYFKEHLLGTADMDAGLLAPRRVIGQAWLEQHQFLEALTP
jgi:tRNA pseudouridine55 synthase